jgi:CMP/dCMP kinase
MTRRHEKGRSRSVIVAIDGPAGSGKSTTARELARRLGFLHVDSGAFYRALTVALLADGVPEEGWERLRPDDLDRFDIQARRADSGLRLFLGDRPLDRELRSADVNARVSHLARIPAVRSWLLQRLRDLADREHVVSDGRDVGTVVFPDAELKVFLVADPEVRARRRLLERDVADPDRDTLMAEIGRLTERDRIDSEREVAPLRAADDAITVDTTALTFDEQIDAILELVRARSGPAAAPAG